MVRGLVEQQQVRRGEQQGGERDAHPPAAREAVERPLLRLLVEAEADQDAGRARRRGMGVDRVQPLVDLAEAVRDRSACSASSSSAARSVSAASTVSNGVARRPAPPARYSRSACRVGISIAPSSASSRPATTLHQGRLAGAVAPDQADAAPGGSAAEARSRMRWPPKRRVMPSSVSMVAVLIAPLRTD